MDVQTMFWRISLCQTTGLAIQNFDNEHIASDFYMMIKENRPVKQ
jgi:hypothetical protein